MALGFILFTNLNAGMSLMAFTIYFIPVGVGMGVFQAPNNSTVMGAATKDQLGVVGGFLAFARALGQTTGVAVLGALWASRVLADAGSSYSGAATDALTPAQVSGLQQTLMIVIMLMLVALGLTAWHWLQNRRVAPQTAEPTA